jgi:hypothetical protein
MCEPFRAQLGWQDWAEDFSDPRIRLRFPIRCRTCCPELRPTDPHAIFRPIDPPAPQ